MLDAKYCADELKAVEKKIEDLHVKIKELRKKQRKNKLDSDDEVELECCELEIVELKKKEDLWSKCLDIALKSNHTTAHIVTPLPSLYWKVIGRVKNSHSVIGVRSRLHNAVDTHLGYNEEGIPGFTYEGNDLLVNVVFEYKENALRFESSLRNESINLKSSLNNLEVSAEVSSSSSVRLGRRVYFSDYVPSDSDSPQFTEPVSADIFSVFEETSDEFKYQRIERLAVFGKRGKAESCHLMSSSDCKKNVDYKDYDLDASNRLALSRDMHGWFEALSCDIPLFWLDVKEVSTEPVLEGRYKVDLVLKAYDKEAAEMIFWRLKDGSEREKEDDLVIYTQVHVQKPKFFQDCLLRKKNQIENRWKDYESMASPVP